MSKEYVQRLAKRMRKPRLEFSHQKSFINIWLVDASVQKDERNHINGTQVRIHQCQKASGFNALCSKFQRWVLEVNPNMVIDTKKQVDDIKQEDLIESFRKRLAFLNKIIA